MYIFLVGFKKNYSFSFHAFVTHIQLLCIKKIELHFNEKSVQSVFCVVERLEIVFERQVEPRWEGAEAISQGGARALGLQEKTQH